MKRLKELSKPLGEFPTWEEARDEITNLDDFWKIPSEQGRQKALDRSREQWSAQHAALAERNGATHEDLLNKTKDIAAKIYHLVKPALGPGAQLAEDAVTDRTQLAIDLAMFGMGPESIVGKSAYRILMEAPLGRIATAATAGAIGGATEGDAVGGAERGALEEVGGQGLLGMGKGAAYLARKRVQPKMDFDRLASFLSKYFNVDASTPEKFRSLFKEGKILPLVDGEFDKINSSIRRHLGRDVKVSSPQIGADFPFDQTVDFMHQLESDGWNIAGNPVLRGTSVAKRDAAHQLEKDIFESLNAQEPTLADRWYQASGRRKAAQTIRNILKNPKVWDSNELPKLDVLQPLIKDTAPGSHGYSLLQSMGEEGQDAFNTIVHRGAPSGSANDRPGQSLFSGFRFYGHGMSVHPNMPYPARHAGEVAFDFGPGRLLKGLATVGPYSLMQNITDMTAMPGYVEGSSKTTGGQPLPPPTMAPNAR